jgi:Tfp pilus assembly protein PilO
VEAKTAKQELIELLQRLPDDTPMDNLLAEVHLIASIARGREDIRRGNVLTQDEVRRRLNEWLESSGRKKLTETSSP